MNCPDPQPLSVSTPHDAVILLGRSSLSASARRELEQLRNRLQLLMPNAHVGYAVADRDGPGLSEALDECLATCPALTQVLVQPVLMPTDPALLLWLQKLTRRWQHAQSRASREMRIVFVPSLMSVKALAPLLADNLADAHTMPAVEQTTPKNWQNDPEGWSELPSHPQHLLFCMGPRCITRGATALWARLIDQWRAHSELKKQIMPLQTGCLYPCNHGPMMIVYPDGNWFGYLDQDAIDQIIEARLDPRQVKGKHVLRRCDSS